MSDNIINLSDYKEKKELNDLAKRVADIIAMIELMQGKMPVYLIDDKGELVDINGEGEPVEPGAVWWDPDVPELKVPPHLSLVDDPDDCA